MTNVSRWFFGAALFSAFGLAGSAVAQEQKVDAAASDAKASPTSAESQLAYGRVLRLAGRSKEAATVLQHGSLLGSAHGDLGDSLRYELMRAYADQKDHLKAIATCNAVHAAAMRHACLAEALVTIRRLGSDAEPEVAAALKADSNLYEAKYVEGLTAALEGDVALAVTAFQAAAAKDAKRVDAPLALGRVLDLNHRDAEALAAFQKAVEVAPDHPEALYELGRVTAKPDDARPLLESAVKGRPSYGAAWARLGDVLLVQGKADDAAAAAVKATGLDAQQPDWQASLAEARVAQKRWDDALNAVKAAVAIVPNHGRARMAEGDALAGRGDIDQAISAYQAAFNALRTDPTPLVRAATACLAGGRETSAKGFTDRATHEFPKWGPAWDIAGDVAWKRGEKPDAKAAWEKALTSDGPIDAAAIKAKLAKIK
jgi:tetratricopeptide (TPR) repeat protein